MHLASIYLHPVKSLSGVQVATCQLDAFGVRGDRRFMITGPDGAFITQRTHPRLALLGAHLDSDTLRLEGPHAAPLSLPRAPTGPSAEVRIWGDTVDAVRVGDRADQWLSDFLGTGVHLVHMAEDTVRQVDRSYAPAGARVGFADGFSLLLIGQGSLDDLNGRLDIPVPMIRFRPNLVVQGAPPHAEDDWRTIRIGEVLLDVVKPCARCVMTTVDPATGEKGVEPLRTLATYRRVGGNVMFGQNLVHRSEGTLRVGDPLEVIAA